MNNNFGNRSKKDIFKLVALFLISLTVICISIFLLQIAANSIIYFITTIILIVSSIAASTILGVFIVILIDYNWQKKHKKIVMEKLTCDYKQVYLNTDCLKATSHLLQFKRIYKAKLDSYGYIILKIENASDSDDFHQSITANYGQFCQMFRFEE